MPPADYPKRAQENMQGARFTKPRVESGLSNMYYDYSNNRQTQTAPVVVQIAQGIIPLTTTQDAKFINVSQKEVPRAETSCLIEIQSFEKGKTQTILLALVVTRKRAKVVILGVWRLLGRPNGRAVLSIMSSTNRTYWT
jgi:hypothetical protein